MLSGGLQPAVAYIVSAGVALVSSILNRRITYSPNLRYGMVMKISTFPYLSQNDRNIKEQEGGHNFTLVEEQSILDVRR